MAGALIAGERHGFGRGRRAAGSSRPLSTPTRHVEQRARPPHTEACGTSFMRLISSSVGPGATRTSARRDRSPRPWRRWRAARSARPAPAARARAEARNVCCSRSSQRREARVGRRIGRTRVAALQLVRGAGLGDLRRHLPARHREARPAPLTGRATASANRNLPRAADTRAPGSASSGCRCSRAPTRTASSAACSSASPGQMLASSKA